MVRENISQVVTILGAAAFASVGFYVLISDGLPRFNQAMLSRSWVSTRGIVEASGITNRVVSGQTQYLPRIRYVFFLNGKIYRGTRFDLGIEYSTNDRSVAESIVSKYEKGKSIEVFYDPKNPVLSALRTGASTSNYVLLLGSILFIICGLWVEFVTIKKVIVNWKLSKAKANEEEPVYGVMNSLAGVGTQARQAPQASTPIEIRSAAQRRAARAQKGKWYVIHDEKRYGPYDLKKIEAYVQDGRVNAHHICVSVDGQVQISVGELLKGKVKNAS